MAWEHVAPRIAARLAETPLDLRPALEAQLAALVDPWLAARIDDAEFARRLTLHGELSAGRDPAYRSALRDATAWHEAGHAVVGRALGFDVVRVTIDPEAPDLSLGHVSYRAPDSATHEDECVLTLAGPLAELVAGFRNDASLDQHRADCNRLVLDGRPGVSLAARLAFLRYVELRASELVHHHWPTITRVHDALLVSPTLDALAFLAVVHRPALPSPPLAA